MTASPRSPGLQLLAFQGVWIVSAFGAAAGMAWPGIVSAVVLLGWYVLAVGGGHRGIVLALSCGLTGLIAETALVGFGWVRYGAPWPHPDLAPIWVIGLWAAFATTLQPTRRLLGLMPLTKAAVVGALLGPLSYLAGERIGALTLAEPVWTSLFATAAVWCIGLPALLALSARLGR